MCEHKQVTCLNPYEYIRKYKCVACGEIMMCHCEKEFALRFLPHQIDQAPEYETGKTFPVTLGFQNNICNSCRGFPEETNPVAEIYGRSSKIRRYYWREIYFETTIRYTEWVSQNNYSDVNVAHQENPDIYKKIEKEVIREMKELHAQSPKYTYIEESQSDVISKNYVEIIDVDATYIKTKERKSAILSDGKIFTVEEFSEHYFSQKGYKTLLTESIPFHVLFGIYMWLLIQDPSDPQVRIIGFGDRLAFDEGRKGEQIWTHLPDDFGTKGYAARRSDAINEHLKNIPNDREEIIWLFDYWKGHSENLRQYLWAHRENDVKKAKILIKNLPIEVLHRILKYLVGDYWGRYTGWPDLFVYSGKEFFFVEVKSSRDRLRENQKNWIYGNSSKLNLPFYLMKIHKKQVVDERTA